MLDRTVLAQKLAQDLFLNPEAEAVFPATLSSIEVNDKISEFRARYQLYNLNRKAESKGVPETQKSQAFTSFLEIQEVGEQFNRNFKPSEELWKARSIVHDLLPCLHYVIDDVFELCTFGPGTFHGALKDLRNMGYSLHYKVGHDQTVTCEAKPLALQVILKYFPRWADSLAKWGRQLHVREGNKLSHVPKDVKKCRPIAIEPSLNVFLQQGIGRWLGKHMANEGFADIFHGQARNRKLAGNLANGTIDLSNASDMIFTSLVKFLLPPEWYDLLNAVRCHRWEFRDRTGTYSNFSSQGNAFTFPLETLIFKAVVMAYTGLSRSEVTVYGDDIIVPVEFAERAVFGLTESGFRVNSEKSYYGQHDDERKYFRESCGADYFYEEIVTPLYLRKDPEKLSDLAVLFNRVVELWPSARGTLDYVLSCVPPHLQSKVLYGPRVIITDDPARFVQHRSLVVNMSLNSFVQTYSHWFWTEGPLADEEPSYKMWISRAKTIGPRQRLSEEVSLLTFLLGDRDSIPRLDKGITVRCDYTPYSGCPSLFGRRAERVAFWLPRRR